MTDTIKKAVSLADGWDLTEGQLTAPDGSWTYVQVSQIPQHYLDALAAQLTRQVDAAGAYITTYIGRTDVHSTVTQDQLASVRGDDRAMNTINAIVESGVLSDE